MSSHADTASEGRTRSGFSWAPWTPKLVESLRDYSLAKFSRDLLAGVTVGLVALPLAMAFAISSGLSPQAGIYCAVVAGFISSLLGGSRYQISGPTGAFVVVVFGIVSKYGVEGLFLCTLMAGVMLLGLGVTGLGAAVKFIPRPVVVGFTNGIALLIASTQVKDFFGLTYERQPGEFIERIVLAFDNFASWSPVATALAAGSLALIIVCVRYAKRVPGAVVALALGTAMATLLHLPVETIETRFGGIPTGLPAFHLPEFRPELLGTLIAPAVTVALLGAIESLMSAVVADRMTRDRHNPNMELVAQGVANIVSPLFGGLPSTGAIARTATNIRSGAATPVAGIIHALTLLAVLLFAAPMAKFIPLSVLAAILVMVAYNMGEWREIPQIVRVSKADASVWFITFALTVLADLTVAVQVGMILAALYYIAKVTRTTTVSRVTESDLTTGREHVLHFQDVPDEVAIFRIHGPFLFGSTDKVQEIVDAIDDLPQVVIIRLRNMTAIDATGIQALEELAQRVQESGRDIIFCGMREQPARLLQNAGFHRHVGEYHICENAHVAIQRAKEILGKDKGAA